MQKEKIKKWLSDNRPLLNIKALEAMIGLSPKTLDHFITGRRDLPQQYVQSVHDFLTELNYR